MVTVSVLTAVTLPVIILLAEHEHNNNAIAKVDAIFFIVFYLLKGVKYFSLPGRPPHLSI